MRINALEDRDPFKSKKKTVRKRKEKCQVSREVFSRAMQHVSLKNTVRQCCSVSRL